MSDDTTDTLIDGAEPSMEDILASIRQIIADEDVGSAVDVASGPQGNDAPSESFTIVEVEDTLEMNDNLEAIADEKTAVDDEVSSDFDLLLSEIDGGDAVDILDLDMLDVDKDAMTTASEGKSKLMGLSAVAAASLGAVASAGVATAKSVTEARNSPVPTPVMSGDANDEFETLELMVDDADIPASLDLGAEPDLGDFLTIPNSDDLSAEDDIDVLLESILSDNTNSVTDPAAHMLEDDSSDDELLSELLGDEVEADMPTSAQPPEDIDLVKSLMADLTDDPYEVPTIEDDGSESELVDEILALSMDDETELHSVSSPVEAEALEVTPFLADVDKGASLDDAPISLSDIAQAAEADAERHERGQGFAAVGLTAGAGVLAATTGPLAAVVGDASALANDDEAVNVQEADDILAAINPSSDKNAEPLIEAALEETDTQTIQETLPPQETADMPKAAAKKDAIINEVTEEATSGAFASLNQIVETNADVQERGDRIGDLVQEALRPMLKEWLDKNLKGIVERAVTKEVKRISSGK